LLIAVSSTFGHGGGIAATAGSGCFPKLFSNSWMAEPVGTMPGSVFSGVAGGGGFAEDIGGLGGSIIFGAAVMAPPLGVTAGAGFSEMVASRES
jgi:hypothetical protein